MAVAVAHLHRRRRRRHRDCPVRAVVAGVADTRASPPVDTSPDCVRVKSFAPKRDAQQAPSVPFTVGFIRNGVVEDHEFAARPRMSFGDVVGIVKGQDDASSLPFLARMIQRCLVDDDGTPLGWKPTDIVDKQFTDPDGKSRPIADLPKVTAFEAGSSRRRWVALLESDEAEAEVEQIAEIFEWLSEEAANRPT